MLRRSKASLFDRTGSLGFVLFICFTHFFILLALTFTFKDSLWLHVRSAPSLSLHTQFLFLLSHFFLFFSSISVLVLAASSFFVGHTKDSYRSALHAQHQDRSDLGRRWAKFTSQGACVNRWRLCLWQDYIHNSQCVFKVTVSKKQQVVVVPFFLKNQMSRKKHWKLTGQLDQSQRLGLQIRRRSTPGWRVKQEMTNI